MYDVTIIGGGAAAHSCYTVLSRAGLSINRAFELDSDDRSPLIIGEAHGAYLIARQGAEAGRHLLLASPHALTPERLSLLLENRGRSQALFVWSERRYHPGYRLVSGLLEADATWRPRFLRSETLSLEPSNAALFRLRTLEATGLVACIAATEPLEVAARASGNAVRNAFDLLNLEVTFGDLRAFVQVGLGEAVERREMLLAATSRKAYIDELDQMTPVRLVDDSTEQDPRARARWLACPAPSQDELARQQCIAFLNATLRPQLAEEEATLWRRALDVMAAMELSLERQGAPVMLGESKSGNAPVLRLLPEAA
jgi:hypothetical protein